MEALSFAITFGLIGAAAAVLLERCHRHVVTRSAQRQREKDLEEINEAKFQADHALCRARFSEQELARRQLQTGYQAAWQAGYAQAMNEIRNQRAVERTWAHAQVE